jgi:dTDP-4-amino-4,6-dideoxygalactose transaminase
MYRRGSHALAAGIAAVKKATGASQVTIWLPAYFCNEALDPVRLLPAILKFYPIREDLTPDWAVLEALVVRAQCPAVFVLVHYFGFPNAPKEARAFCDRHGMVLLEDAAHMLMPTAGVGSGDLMIFSPRKLLAVPSGGVLVASAELEASLDTPAGDDARWETISWIVRRFTRGVLGGLNIPRRLLRIPSGRRTYPELTHLRSSAQQAGCDTYALRLLTVMGRQINEVAQRRRQNYARLLDWAASLAQVQPLFPRLENGVCPYAFPLLAVRESEELVARLQAWGIPAGRWPELHPKLLVRDGDTRVASRLYEQLLLLPVHQSLTLRQVDLVGSRLRGALTGN